jgi:hypothetical protein
MSVGPGSAGLDTPDPVFVVDRRNQRRVFPEDAEDKFRDRGKLILKLLDARSSCDIELDRYLALEVSRANEATFGGFTPELLKVSG